MTLDLGSACAKIKIRRANEHFEALKLALNKTGADTGIYKTVGQMNADGTRHSIVLKVNGFVPLEDFALMFGDCIHNLRCALDHVVYSIAIHQTGNNPPPDWDVIGFPICDTAIDFERVVRKQKRSRLTGISDSVRTIIERAQPYNRPKPYLLSMLRDFDIRDKHHLTNVCFAALQQGNFANFKNVPPAAKMSVGIFQGELKNGAEIAAVIFDRPAPDVTYDWTGHVYVCVPLKQPGPSGEKHAEIIGLLSALLKMVPLLVTEITAATTC